MLLVARFGFDELKLRRIEIVAAINNKASQLHKIADCYFSISLLNKMGYESLTDYGLTRALAHLLYGNYCVSLSSKAKCVKGKCLCIVIAV